MAGVNRVDKGRMEELREEIGLNTSFKRKLVRSSLKWAKLVDRMEGNG